VKLRFLGTGTSFGVPQIGCMCAVCRSTDPRDKRTRCGAVIETDDGTRLLIDTPPELRLQLIAAEIDHIDAVLFTHEHADHIHGIDDLRAFSLRSGRRIPMFADQHTLAALRERFPYIVEDQFKPVAGTSRPEAHLIPVETGVPFLVGATLVFPFAVPHGRSNVLAYRVGDIGYVTDAKALPESARRALAGVRVLVLNALLRDVHPTHLSIAEAIAVAQQVGAERTFFTHLTHHTSHADLAAELPPGISPAFDGLVVSVE
jgi:phosphoribosyl 1,2-cyclic phosphate phosphodiesterase